MPNAFPYTLHVKHHLSAALQLPQHPGICQHMHGYTYEVEAIIQGGPLDDAGMSLDLHTCHSALKKCLSPFDHTTLNDHVAFKTCPPSTENLARVIYDTLSATLPANCQLQAIRIATGPDHAIQYQP